MLSLRVMRECERVRFSQLEGKNHYMGETRSGGDTLRLVVEEDGVWIALMVWGSACYRLKDRDQWIGWSARLRAHRQKLVVMNRRFTLLCEKGRRTNLASRVLGLAVRELPGLWHDAFGYEPLVAETFSDIESAAGTCYRAAGWIEIGRTKGFSRHRRDFYVPNARPKKLWVKPLRPHATQMLCALELPAECRKGSGSDAWGVLPLAAAQTESLHEALCHVADPRRSNRQFHVGTLLSIVSMAVMGGARNLAQVVRFAETLTLAQRKALGLPRWRKDSEYRKTPSYSAFYNLLRKLDIDAFAHQMSGWLQAHQGQLPRQLALDGKYIGDVVGIVSLVDTDTGVPVAVMPSSQKEGEGDRCEMRVGRRLMTENDLTNATVSADALHCQADTMREVALSGGESILQLKANQKTVLETAKQLAARNTPFLPGARKKATGGSNSVKLTSIRSRIRSQSACPTSKP